MQADLAATAPSWPMHAYFAALRAASLMPAKRQRVDSGARAHNPAPVAADVAARPPSAYV